MNCFIWTADRAPAWAFQLSWKNSVWRSCVSHLSSHVARLWCAALQLQWCEESLLLHGFSFILTETNTRVLQQDIHVECSSLIKEDGDGWHHKCLASPVAISPECTRPLKYSQFQMKAVLLTSMQEMVQKKTLDSVQGYRLNERGGGDPAGSTATVVSPTTSFDFEICTRTSNLQTRKNPSLVQTSR